MDECAYPRAEIVAPVPALVVVRIYREWRGHYQRKGNETGSKKRSNLFHNSKLTEQDPPLLRWYRYRRMKKLGITYVFCAIERTLGKL